MKLQYGQQLPRERQKEEDQQKLKKLVLEFTATLFFLTLKNKKFIVMRKK